MFVTGGGACTWEIDFCFADFNLAAPLPGQAGVPNGYTTALQGKSLEVTTSKIASWQVGFWLYVSNAPSLPRFGLPLQHR